MPTGDSRPRLSVDLPWELYNKLNNLLGDWRIKSRLFRAISFELVRVMERMDAKQREFFLVSILEGDIEIEKYIKQIKKAKDAAEKFKEVDSRNSFRGSPPDSQGDKEIENGLYKADKENESEEV